MEFPVAPLDAPDSTGFLHEVADLVVLAEIP